MGELKEMNDKTAPAKRPFSQIAVVIFALVFLVHFLRLVFGWEIHLNGMLFPNWASILACLLTAALSYGLCRELRK